MLAAAWQRPAGPVAAAAAMAPIVPAVPSLAAFFKKSRLGSIAFVHTKKAVATSTRVESPYPASLRGPATDQGIGAKVSSPMASTRLGICGGPHKKETDYS